MPQMRNKPSTAHAEDLGHGTEHPPAVELMPVVLVVGATAAFAPALATALGPGYQVACARTNRAAMAAARSCAPDLIVLAVSPPGKDGFDLCRRLQSDQHASATPVIFCADTRADDAEIRALELGAVDFLVQPIKPRPLALRIVNQLRQRRRQDALQAQSSVDPETGLGNRRCMEDTLVREWHRARRLQTPLSLVLVELDRADRAIGAPARDRGDDPLRRVAKALKAALHRPGDIATRYGHGQFAAILPETDADGAGYVVARIRAATAGGRGRPQASAVDRPLRVTLGTVSCVPGAEQDPVQLLRRADEQLKRARNKRHAGGRVRRS